MFHVFDEYIIKKHETLKTIPPIIEYLKQNKNHLVIQTHRSVLEQNYVAHSFYCFTRSQILFSGFYFNNNC